MENTNTVFRLNTDKKERRKKSTLFHKKQLTSLKKGKAKRMGLIERLALKIAGRRDGKRGLPVQEKGIWRSPYLDKEVKTYYEFCSSLWGRLQLEAEGTRAKIRLLMASIHKNTALLKQARKELADEHARLEPLYTLRRTGEENLTDAQVRLRREKELEPRLAPLYDKIHALVQALDDDRSELNNLKSVILELEESTSMICRRVMDHTQLRAAIYWDAALKHHPDSQSLPMSPELTFRQDAEQDYRSSCNQLFEPVRQNITDTNEEVV